VGQERRVVGQPAQNRLLLYRIYRQLHFLAQRAADESANAVSLPSGCLHNLGERCATLPLEQTQDLRFLATVARCGRVVATFSGFPLGSLRGALRLLALLGGYLWLVGLTAVVAASVAPSPSRLWIAFQIRAAPLGESSQASESNS
jgi:hypothetical protein